MGKISLRWRSLSYRAKLLLAILSVNVLLVFIMILNRVAVAKSFIFEREDQLVENLGQLLAEEIAFAELQDNTERQMQLIDLSRRRTSISFVSILDTRDFVCHSTLAEAVGKPTAYRDSGRIVAERSDTYIRSFPLQVQGRILGRIQIGYSLAQVRRDLRYNLGWAAGIGGATILFTLLIAWWISGPLLQPLAEMRAFSARIAGGDFSARAHVASRDLIGQLAAALNEMAAQLGDLTDNMNRKIESATRELTESNRRLQELDRLKSDFVSLVSHELRTPLTSIIGFAKTLHTLELPPEQRLRYLQIIETEGKRLADLIEEYLDISKIEARTFVLRPGPVDLPRLVAGCLEILGAEARNRILNLVPAALPPLRGDADRLRRVFLNLLANALRYTPPGEAVRLTAEATGAGIVCAVEDRGPGIPAADLPRLFEKFYRGHDEIAKKSRGTGLGLAIAKAVIEAHGGWVRVESEPGVRTRFSFLIPTGEKAP